MVWAYQNKINHRMHVMNNKKLTEQGIKIGISACLIGQEVRYDSSHKRSHFCLEELGKHVEYKAYCPEVAIGLPIPRKAIRQIRHGDLLKVSQADGSGDVTEALKAYGKKSGTANR